MKSVFLRYHGSFFASLIDNSPIPLQFEREFPDDNHLYVLNNNVGLYVTYSTKRLSPWVLTFQPKHLEAISDQMQRHKFSFLILVCGFETTAVLSSEEVTALIPINSPTTCSITIRTGHDKKLAVSGSSGKLKGKLSKTRTYSRLLEILS